VTDPISATAIELSIVVPMFNEAGSVAQMHQELVAACEPLGRTFEIVFVDDGSNDGTDQALEDLANADPRVIALHLRRNFGKSPALQAGFERVRGQVVLTLDGDLQDDPAMIPDFLARIDAGADLVSGWKQTRHDPLGKRLPSKLFNAVVRRLTGIPLNDFNCGFKAYHIDCIRELQVYGGLHRFLPVLAGIRGFRIEQLVVRHRPRLHGSSKFGVSRLFDGLFDLLTVLLLTKFRTRPLHFFGVPGLFLGLAGMAILVYLTVIWFLGDSIGTRPLLTLGVLLTITAAQFIGIGLLAELLVRTTIKSSEVFSLRPPKAREGRQLRSPKPAALAANEHGPATSTEPTTPTTEATEPPQA